jgi:hypothetical protein
MAKFWVDYATYVLIEAETAEEARKLFLIGCYEPYRPAEREILGIEESDENEI